MAPSRIDLTTLGLVGQLPKPLSYPPSPTMAQVGFELALKIVNISINHCVELIPIHIVARETKIQLLILIVEKYRFLCFFTGEFWGFSYHRKIGSLMITMVPFGLIISE